MKKFFVLVLGLALPFLLAITLSSCKKDKVTVDNQEPEGDGLIQNAVKDYDGNTYDAVKLGIRYGWLLICVLPIMQMEQLYHWEK